jgi:hypothetical protein
MTMSQQVVTLLVQSNTRGAAVLHPMFEGKIEYMPLVRLTPMALEMDHRDYTTRVCRGEVWALSHPLINEAQ